MFCDGLIHLYNTTFHYATHKCNVVMAHDLVHSIMLPTSVMCLVTALAESQLCVTALCRSRETIFERLNGLYNINKCSMFSH